MISGTDAGVSPGAELGHPSLCIWMGSWKAGRIDIKLKMV